MESIVAYYGGAREKAEVGVRYREYKGVKRSRRRVLRTDV